MSLPFWYLAIREKITSFEDNIEGKVPEFSIYGSSFKITLQVSKGTNEVEDIMEELVEMFEDFGEVTNITEEREEGEQKITVTFRSKEEAEEIGWSDSGCIMVPIGLMILILLSKVGISL